VKPIPLPNRGVAFAAATALALLAAPGCFWAPELAGVRRDIEAQLPDATFDKNIELSLGPLTMKFARLVTGLIPDAREARGYLKDVNRVEIAVYEAHLKEPAPLRTPERLRSLLDDGWELAVRVRETDEAVWLLYRADEESIREVFIVVLNTDELVLVRARGRLERLVAHALRESHGRPWAPREGDGRGPTRAPSGT